MERLTNFKLDVIANRSCNTTVTGSCWIGFYTIQNPENTLWLDLRVLSSKREKEGSGMERKEREEGRGREGERGKEGKGEGRERERKEKLSPVQMFLSGLVPVNE